MQKNGKVISQNSCGKQVKRLKNLIRNISPQGEQQPVCSVIITTHNHEKTIYKTMQSLQQQTRKPDHVIIIDSASRDSSYLRPYRNQKNVEVITEKENLGFCKSNNLAMKRIPQASEYVLFLNPDAFLTPQLIEQAIEFMEKPLHKRIAILTGILLGYDIERDLPNNQYDSTGIFRTWYGRWHDRDQGKKYTPNQHTSLEKVPAICGALMFCRKKALDEVLIRNEEVFDNSFFMYKEDIDLSLRLKKAGWDLVLMPSLTAYHCRGWDKVRSRVPRKLRLCAARNELRLHIRHRSIYTFSSLLKYLLVIFFNI